MSCWHGWHGCGPWPGGPQWGGWYDPAEWAAEPDWPGRRRYRRARRTERDVTGEELEARLDDLLREIRQVEAELAGLRGAEDAAERP